MFFIYINDLAMLKLNSNLILYADDMIVFTSDTNWTRIEPNPLEDIQKIDHWTVFNRLTINFTKSKFQLFGNKSKLNQICCPPALNVGTETLERVTFYDYLGVILDPELKFERAMVDTQVILIDCIRYQLFIRVSNNSQPYQLLNLC